MINTDQYGNRWLLIPADITDREAEDLLNDKARLDWLADIDNCIGNVELPAQCVTDNLGCMRAAIDAAMEIEQ